MEISQPPTAAPANAHSSITNNHTSARSCITCAKAKAKCVRQPGHQICDRCARLHKDCQLKEPVQRRRKPAKLSRTAQLENLENKLQNLVHALSTQQSQQSQQPQSNENGHPSPSTSSGASVKDAGVANSIISSTCNQTYPSASNITSCGAPLNALANEVAMTPASSYAATRPMTYDSTLSMEEATMLLDRYQRLLAPSMPFVVLESGIDAWSLTHKKPFLMQVIAAVAYFHDLPKQQVMVKDLMRQISEKLMMRNEKSLEVLQGMLILIAWYHPHIVWAQQSVLLLHLAMSLTADLNIDRAPDTCEKFRLAHGTGTGIPALPPFTNDERRAFLGTFYLTSMMSTSFKKLSALKWSPWMTECAATLERELEYESDAFLVSIVRIQHLTEDIMAVESFDAPVQFLANSYKADLDRIPKPSLSGTPKILMEHQEATAQVAIWTHSLSGLAEKKSFSSPTHSGQLRQRLDGLWRCVEALRVFFEIYLAISPQNMLILPFQIFGQSVQTSVTILRLATLEIDGWDLNALRGELNYSAIMGEITRKFESIEKVHIDGLPVKNDAFTRWGAKTRWMKTLYDSRYPDDSSPAAIGIDVSEGGRRWPNDIGNINCTEGHDTQQQNVGAESSNPAVGNTFIQPLQQQPTPVDERLPSDEWLANPQNVFTYFDDAFWNSIRFDNIDFSAGVGAAGTQDVQMGAYPT